MRKHLKQEILKRYRTQRSFAQACQQSDDWVSKIVLGIKKPNKEEKKLIVSKLKAGYSDNLFLKQKVFGEQ